MDYLAFDLGASSGKMFRGKYDGSRLTLKTVHRFENAAVPLNQGLYWDFLSIWKNLCLGMQKAAAEGAFCSVGIDTYCNDFSFINKGGELLAPMRSYRDERTTRCADAIYQKMSPRQLYEETGNQIAPFNTLMQLAAMQAEQSDAILHQAHRLLFLPDLMAYYITGETLAEYTVSSVSQMFRFDTGSWSDTILNRFGIPQNLFGTLTSPATISGHATKQFQNTWGLGSFDFVSVCEHDTASAFLALPGNRDRAILSSGTWALVGCENPEPIINDYGFRYNIANEGSLPGHHRLLRNVMGSWILQELRAEYQRSGEDYTFAQLEELAKGCKPFAFLMDVDDDVFFSPGHMRRKIREKCWTQSGGLPETPGQFVRCVCESLALKYRWCLEKLEGLTGRTFPEISVIGGGSKDVLTCTMTANACGRSVVAGPADASAMGNILCQLLAHGEIADIAQGRQLIESSNTFITYEPQDTAEWESVYQSFAAHFQL